MARRPTSNTENNRQDQESSSEITAQHDKKFINKFKNTTSVVFICATIFGTGGTIGYQAGVFISDIKCSENNMKSIGEFQREREELKDEINAYKFSNTTYATKEEVEELKNNMKNFKKSR